jgi:transcriptional regulator with XRE-family HTH domain
MLRNELEYRNAKKQLDTLRTEVEKRSLAVEREIPTTAQAVVGALEMKIDDIKRELDDYEYLKSGDVSEFVAGSLDEFGEVVTKARIAKGWSQVDLAKAAGIHHQQIQRYERNDWQKINLWRLQEIVETLSLRLSITARISDEPALWPGVHRHIPSRAAKDVDQASVLTAVGWATLGKGTVSKPVTASQEGESGLVDRSKENAPITGADVLTFAP